MKKIPRILDYSILILGLSAIYRIFDNVEIYMDEQFHVPQAQSFCKGDFISWNPKITTLPGLYFFSVFIKSSLAVFSSSWVCSTSFLRFTNLIVAIATFFIVERCRDLIRPGNEDARLIAALVTLFPPHFFFYFLYYTDALSTSLVLLLYAFTIMRRNYLRAHNQSHNILLDTGQLLIGLFSIATRQTNVVWVLFALGCDALSLHLLDATQSYFSASFPSRLWQFIWYLLSHPIPILKTTAPLVVATLAFVAFILVNGSIVVGDKENHVPILHLAMPLHHCAITAAYLLALRLQDCFCFCIAGVRVATGPRCKLSDYVWGAVGSAITSYVLVQYSYGHPFILSDNRHYMFYIWNRYLHASKVRLWLGPVYFLLLSTLRPSLCSPCIGHSETVERLVLDSCRQRVRTLISATAVVVTPSAIAAVVDVPTTAPTATTATPSTSTVVTQPARDDDMWLLIYITAVIISLTPAPLLELRYFNIGVSIAVLHLPMHQVSTRAMYAAILMFALASVAAVYIFVFKPFVWNDGSVARFML